MKYYKLLALTLAFCFANISAEERNNLFVHSNKNDLTPKQEKILKYLRSQKMNSQVTTVEINPKAFTAPDVMLNISPSVMWSANTKQLDKIRDTTQWVGEIADSPDSASFIVHGQNITGTIQNKDKMYSVKPIGGGLHAIIEQNPTGFPDEHPPEYDELEKALPEIKDVPILKNQPQSKTNDSNELMFDRNADEISVFVAYTNAVDNVVVDPDGLIELAIKETNDSYGNSNIAAKVRLVGSKKIDYLESNSFRTDLARLSNKNDGFMDGLHSLRDSNKADVVVLLINNDSYCGLADAILADEGSAFAIVYHNCATGYYSFGHEIGHLQGARHNPEADSGVPFNYGHGYFHEANHVRTVMSYNCPAGCRRLPIWSNPQIKHNGRAMGTAEKHNNSRVLGETLTRLSGFR